MKSIKRLSFLLASAAALVLSACTPSGTDKPKDAELVLLPSVESIKADGKAEVTFTVMLGDENVTSKATIENVTGETPVITGNTFKSDKPGEFKFRATYNDKTSAVITITASISELKVDKDKIFNNGEIATFTVMYGDLDVTEESIITYVTKKEEWAMGVNTFKAPITLGEYEFSARYKGQVTNTVKVTVEKAPISELRLATSKGRIKPDGVESTTFTVFYKGEDVTANAKVKNLTSGEYIENNTFSYSGSANAVSFVAEYNNVTSPALQVGFGDFYKKVYIAKITGTWCGYCADLTVSFNKALETHPDRIEMVAVHYDDALQIKDYASFSKIHDIVYNGSPTAPVTFYDGNSNDLNRVLGSKSSSEVLQNIKTFQRKGAGAGIAAVSKIDGNTLTIDVNVTASVEREYSLGVMLCEDYIKGYPQTSDPNKLGANYPHNHTLRAMGNGPAGQSIGTLAVNEQVTKSFTFDLTGYNKENCNVVLFVAYKNGEFYSVTNTAMCPAGGWVDYRFEE